METIAALYALFIAVLVLSIQKNNQKATSLIGDLLKPPFKFVSYTIAITIYFNGFVLFIFSFYKPIGLEISVLYFGSLISLFSSLIAIIYFSFWIISTVTGLNTHEEMLYNLSQGRDIEACYLSLSTDADKWDLISENQKNKDIELYIKLLECGNSNIKSKVADVLGNIRDKRTVEQLIKNINHFDLGVIVSSIKALDSIGDERAVEELIKKLNDPNDYIRSVSAEALGKIGDKRVVGPLIKKLDDSNSGVKMNSINALGNIGDKRAVEKLIEKLDNDSDNNVRASSAKALGNIGDIRAVEPLIKKLGDFYSGVKAEFSRSSW